MYKIFKSDKDTYITNKVVRSQRVTGSNVGGAGTLDLFKLYGATYTGNTPNTELSRLLLHFDLSELKTLYANKKIDIADPSFTCKINLRDVYGGQPTPANFTVSIFPLSASFDEGIGRDIAYYTDGDVANWSSSSLSSAWLSPGCDLGGGATETCDYITSSLSIPNTEIRQTFKSGTEDLLVDVTKLVSATLTSELPDSGFRISFENSHEVDSQTYFVKRFASRSAYNEAKHPSIRIGFNDSIADDTQNMTFDTPCNVTLYNFAGGKLQNIVSGSSLTPITGSNILGLKLTMTSVLPSGTYSLNYDASQFSLGSTDTCFVDGIYQAVVTIPSSDPQIAAVLQTSSSISFTPTWVSLDNTLEYATTTKLTVRKPNRTYSKALNNYVVSVRDLKSTYSKGAEDLVRVHIFDYSSPLVTVVKVPVELPGIVVRDVYYQIRDAVTGETVVPFDDVTNSTRASSDGSGMFFTLDTSSLSIGSSYVIDIMVSKDGQKTQYRDASAQFRIEA